jgi:hypothetical protein
MTNDCLRFHPTVATTCYGMNDHEYRPYEDSIGEAYRRSMLGVVESFKAQGVRVVLGSPGCVGNRNWWQAGATTARLNENLCRLRNIDIEIAGQEKVAFADVFWPMIETAYAAPQRYGTNYLFPARMAYIPIGQATPSWPMHFSKRWGWTVRSPTSEWIWPAAAWRCLRDINCFPAGTVNM